MIKKAILVVTFIICVISLFSGGLKTNDSSVQASGLKDVSDMSVEIGLLHGDEETDHIKIEGVDGDLDISLEINTPQNTTTIDLNDRYKNIEILLKNNSLKLNGESLSTKIRQNSENDQVSNDIDSDLRINDIIKLSISGSNDQPVKLSDNQRKYRGALIVKPGDEDLMVTNDVNVEDYLKGVVPAEVYLSWNMEALKAQAVASRSYAVHAMTHSDNTNLFDMTDCQKSQVYKGYTVEEGRTNQAIEATSGELIYYRDEVLNAIYHSNAGGETERPENVWGSQVNYLQSVDSSWDESALESGAPESYHWEKQLTREEITQKLDEAYEIGNIIDIEILEYSSTGRVVEALYRGSKGEKVLFGDDNRGPFDLRSTKFQVESTRDDTEIHIKSGKGEKTRYIENENLYAVNGDSEIDRVARSDEHYYIQSSERKRQARDTLAFLFSGYGFGHGLGMSQWGAHGMSEEGYDYQEILKYYYTDDISIH